jgi:hypothetical protein
MVNSIVKTPSCKKEVYEHTKVLPDHLSEHKNKGFCHHPNTLLCEHCRAITIHSLKHIATKHEYIWETQFRNRINYFNKWPATRTRSDSKLRNTSAMKTAPKSYLPSLKSFQFMICTARMQFPSPQKWFSSIQADTECSDDMLRWKMFVLIGSPLRWLTYKTLKEVGC